MRLTSIEHAPMVLLTLDPNKCDHRFQVVGLHMSGFWFCIQYHK